MFFLITICVRSGADEIDIIISRIIIFFPPPFVFFSSFLHDSLIYPSLLYIHVLCVFARRLVGVWFIKNTLIAGRNGLGWVGLNKI